MYRHYWVARAKRDYFCDICRKLIKKGEKRIVEGLQTLVYVMIDKNICVSCYEKMKAEGNDPLDDEEKRKLYM